MTLAISLNTHHLHAYDLIQDERRTMTSLWWRVLPPYNRQYCVAHADWIEILPGCVHSTASAVYDSKMALFDRRGSSGDYKGQAEQDKAAAIFILEPGRRLEKRHYRLGLSRWCAFSWSLHH